MLVNSGHRVELRSIPIGTIDCSDLTGIVQKTVGIACSGLETELVDDVVVSIPVIVDFDFIQDIIAEFVEIWSTSWLL